MFSLSEPSRTSSPLLSHEKHVYQKHFLETILHIDNNQVIFYSMGNCHNIGSIDYEFEYPLSGWRIQLTGLDITTAYFVLSLVTAVYLAKWGVMSNE